MNVHPNNAAGLWTANKIHKKNNLGENQAAFQVKRNAEATAANPISFDSSEVFVVSEGVPSCLFHSSSVSP